MSTVSPSPFIPQCGKIGHPSRKIAQAALRTVLNGQDNGGRDRRLLGVFLCKTCRLHHLGNADERFLREHRKMKRAARNYVPTGDDE